MALGQTPKITWGTAYANTLAFGYPLFDAVAYPSPRDGSEWATSPGGSVDAWIVGTDEILEADVRYIPISTTSSPVATGWDTATIGWRHFLSWARQGNAFRFYPEKDTASYVDAVLVEPLEGGPSTEADGTKALRLKIRATSSSFSGF